VSGRKSSDTARLRHALERCQSWNKKNGNWSQDMERLVEATLAAEPPAAPAIGPAHLAERIEKIIAKWDDGKNNYRGRVIIGELRKAMAQKFPESESAPVERGVEKKE
jgi:hypothetical protein